MAESRRQWEEEAKQRYQAEEKARKRASAELALGGPVAYERYTFEKFDPELNGTQKIFQACLAHDPRKANLLIIGEQRTGKTHLMGAIGHRTIDQGGRVRVFSKKEFAAFVRGRKSYVNDAEEMDAIRYLVELDVLGIDDIEEQPNRDSVLSDLKLVWDLRKKAGKHGGVVTSNKSVAELSDICNPKIASRLEGEFRHLIVPPGTPSASAILKRQGKEG